MASLRQTFTLCVLALSLAARADGDVDASLLAEAHSMQPWLVDIRRELHTIPELAFTEHKTSAFIKRQLDLLSISYTDIKESVTGFYADIGTGEGPMFALRADMDALPIQEPSDSPAALGGWASKTDGCMHACGHDGHVTMLLGAARVLKARESVLLGRVRLVFQPGEEGGGGAKKMVDAGLLKGVAGISGLHVWPGLHLGTIGTRAGAIMAGSDRFAVRIHGRGGHGAMPHLAADPVVAASAIVMALQPLVSRETSPTEGAVVTVAVFNTGAGANNVIPDSVELQGTIRSLSDVNMDRLRRRVTEVAVGTAAVYGCRVEDLPDWADIPYPTTVNDAGMAKMVMTVADGLVSSAQGEAGKTCMCAPGSTADCSSGSSTLSSMLLEDPFMVAEDFAFYGKEVPAVFSFIGIGTEHGTNVSLHSARFQLAEDVLPLGVALHVATALHFLAQHQS